MFPGVCRPPPSRQPALFHPSGMQNEKHAPAQKIVHTAASAAPPRRTPGHFGCRFSSPPPPTLPAKRVPRKAPILSGRILTGCGWSARITPSKARIAPSESAVQRPPPLSILPPAAPVHRSLFIAFKRRARDSNPQPLSGHLISSQTASHSLTLRETIYPNIALQKRSGKPAIWFGNLRCRLRSFVRH